MIEFFYWRECPSHERALAMLRELMVDAEIEANALRVVEVTDDAEAERLVFPGSPTIRVNGVDVQEPGDNPIGLTCRLYIKRDGRPSPLPDIDDVRAALARLNAG